MSARRQKIIDFLSSLSLDFYSFTKSNERTNGRTYQIFLLLCSNRHDERIESTENKYWFQIHSFSSKYIQSEWKGNFWLFLWIITKSSFVLCQKCIFGSELLFCSFQIIDQSSKGWQKRVNCICYHPHLVGKMKKREKKRVNCNLFQPS